MGVVGFIPDLGNIQKIKGQSEKRNIQRKYKKQ